MCDNTPLPPFVHPRDYEKMPSVIASEDPLLNVGKRELEAALRMPHARPWVADWLFSHAQNIFHPRTAFLPPEAFESSLAIHLRHDIRTPAFCTPPPPRRGGGGVGGRGGRGGGVPAGKEGGQDVTVTKDIELLLVPVVCVEGITVGYSFLKGVPESALEGGGGGFVGGRFAFENACRDFLMVVNSMSPHMTGIISMRWRDATSRDRSFFAIPKADYGPGNLPSRVLSVQCNIDYEIDPALDAQVSASFVPPTPRPAPQPYPMDLYGGGKGEAECPVEVPPLADEGGSGGVCDFVERDFAHQGDEEEEEKEEEEREREASRRAAAAEEDPWLGFEDGLTAGWPEGLEAIGTVIAPYDDPDGIIPEVLQDFAGGQLEMEEMERLLSEGSEIISNSSAQGSAESVEAGDGAAGIGGSLKRSQVSLDALEMSPVDTQSSSSVDSLGKSVATVQGNGEGAWIFSAAGATPDGVGVPRHPGSNETSSGAFDMAGLLASLGTIEQSLKGHFYGPKVRKDILHPQTGELISRCTGEVTARLETVDALASVVLRRIAAQAYYASHLSISTDARLLVPAPQRSTHPSTSERGAASDEKSEEPRRKQGRTGASKRPAPAQLAPRPIPSITLPPGLPHPEVLRLPEDSGREGVEVVEAQGLSEEARMEAKLEAKRIKNRLSAARSNQKRRAQLDAQKKELAVLRERVEDLQAKRKHAVEENHHLKERVQSGT